MQFRMLGHLEVAGSRGVRALGGPKQRAVLAYLLLHARSLVPSGRLIEAVWDGGGPAAARTSLHSYVSNLRRAVGDDRIEGRGGGYILHVDGDEVDASRFTALLAQAASMSSARATARSAVLGEALALWRGPALDDLADHPAFLTEATRLNELRAAAREDWIDARLTAGPKSPDDLIPTIEALLVEHPLRERLWAQLITALYHAGRQADALAAYRRARGILRDELGVEPSPELQRVHRRVLTHDPGLEALHVPLRGYRLLERVGGRGPAVRYRAEQPSTGRELLIDVIEAPLADDPDFIRRFESDAQAVAALRHPHLIGPLDWWREPGAAYLVTPAPQGRTLAARIADGTIDREAASIHVQQLRDALDAAHRRGVGHGRIDAHSVWVGDAGDVQVTGFPIGMVEIGDATTRTADTAAVARIADLLLADGGEPAGSAAPRRAAPDRHGRRPNPYKGLEMFREGDAGDFFGRGATVARLVARWRSGGRFLAVVGPSGSGKSSLVRAGLIPALRGGAVPGSERWLTIVMTPGAAPFEELAATLLSVARDAEPNLAARLAAERSALTSVVHRLLPDDAELVLVVDQFEELFSLAANEEERRAFIAAVMDAVEADDGRLRVVVTVRGDFFDRPLRYGTLADALTSWTEVIAPLTPAEIAAAVTGPADGAGIAVEPALLAQIVHDAADETGALPLLQYALTEMYDRGGTTLTVDDYDAVGGLVGALARRADQVLSELPYAAQAAARRLFLHAIALGEGSGDVRRRVHRAELLDLADPSAMGQALVAFDAARLLTFDRDPETREPTVEIAHEALLTRWGRLRTWITTARTELAIERRLAAATHEWVAADRDPSFLATGHRLDQFADLVPAATVPVPQDECDYIDASIAQRERLDAEDEAQRALQEQLRRRSYRRLQAMLAVLGLSVAVAVALTAFALAQRGAARREARVASARELAAAADASLDTDAQRSLLLAIEAVERTTTPTGAALPEAVNALHRAVHASRLVATLEDAIAPVAWGGDVIATASSTVPGAVVLRDPSSLAVVRTVAAHDGAVTGIALDAAGGVMATTGDDGVVRLWDPRTGERRAEIDGGGGPLQAPSIDPDGTVLTVGRSGSVGLVVIDVDRGEIVDALPTDGTVRSTSVSSSGDIAYVAGSDPAQLEVVAHGSHRRRIQLYTASGRPGVAYSPGGAWLATADTGLLDGHTGVALPGPPSSGGIAPVWSADGRRLVIGSLDGAAQVWRVTQDGELVERLTVVSPAGDSEITQAALAPDGTMLLTVDEHGSVHTWDVGPHAGDEAATLPADTFARPGLAWAPDGRRLAVSAGDGDVAIWRTDTWTIEGMLPHGHRAFVTNVAWSPDGDLIATVGRRRAKVWHADTRQLAFQVPYIGTFGDVAWTPDGTHLAVAGDLSAAVTDRTGRQVARLPFAIEIIEGVEFDRDGDLLAVVHHEDDRPDRIDVWRWRDGVLATTVRGGGIATAFDPTGERLVTADGRARPKVIDLASGAVEATLVGHTDSVMDVQFSADGALIATGSEDRTVRLWDAASGDEVAVLPGHDGPVHRVVLSPDGRWLASSSIDDGVRVWALHADDLLSIARRKVTRGLSAQECRQFLHEPICG